MNNYLVIFSLVCFVGCLISNAGAYFDREKFKEICVNDNTNDDAIYLDAQGLIKRSGFDYKEYWSIAADGYITQLVEIINPKADQSQLKKPTVMLFHGANVDMASYLVSSSIQHHPEKYPRTAEDGPITSYNRSIGFTLANNGYRVILVGQRGSNKLNRYYIEDVDIARVQARAGVFKPTEEMYEYSRTSEYWEYDLDDIIEYEIGNQIDDVKYYTNTTEVMILSYSLSTPTTMAFLAGMPEYAKNTTVYVQMAPAIAADHIYAFDYIYFEKLCPYLPTRGIGFTPTFTLKPAVRALIIQLSKSVDLRYSLIYRFVTSLFGPSQKYQANLERNVLAHVFQPVSFKSVQHYCQNSLNKKLTYFDYGKVKNVEYYKQTMPPVYDISRLEVPNYVVVWGTNDALADTTTVQRLIEKTKTPKPAVQIVAPGYNHFDILAGIENDKYVVNKILAEFDKHSH